MPLPLILIGGAALAGVWGAKKGYDAYNTNQEADEIGAAAERLVATGRTLLEDTREQTAESLAELGRLRLACWSRELAGFVDIFSRIKDVELSGTFARDSFANHVVSEEGLAELRDLSLKATEVLSGGSSAVGAGALIGAAAYGTAMTLGTASTGTAISGLAGVAATNATLAWLGGGALSAGGFGVAGGMAVLGGLVAGPALLVGGWALSAKADSNLAKAKEAYARAELITEEMRAARAALRSILKLADQYSDTINRFLIVFNRAMTSLIQVIHSSGLSYRTYSRPQQETVRMAVECAGLLKALLETPLLKPDGSPNTSAQDALQKTDAFLQSAPTPSL